MSLTLTVPALESRPEVPPEVGPDQLAEWLASTTQVDPVECAGALAEALGSLNRVHTRDRRRLEITERYRAAAERLWPLLERHYERMPQPLQGEALAAARAALALAHELSISYKHLLARRAKALVIFQRRRSLLALVHRCLDSAARTIVTCYKAYSPIPPSTWLDAHRVHAFARQRNLHRTAAEPGDPDASPERTYVRMLLVALANPYGLRPGELALVLQYLDAHVGLARLTDVEPVHRTAKAVALVPVEHDFPPFAATKGGAVDGAKLYLLTYDLAFDLQERLHALQRSAGDRRGAEARFAQTALYERLLRQWAIPPSRQFNRIPSRAKVTALTGFEDLWSACRMRQGEAAPGGAVAPQQQVCDVINHTPGGYALRQTEGHPASLRVGDLVALTADKRSVLQVGIVRWFRNAPHGSALEFGCELISEHPEATQATPEHAGPGALLRAVILPPEKHPGSDAVAPPQMLLPKGRSQIEQAVVLIQGAERSLAVLTKLVERGADFELFEYVGVE